MNQIIKKNMKKLFKNLLFTSLFSISALTTYGQANLQIIHNSADPGANTVDIYVNGVLALDDFKFRSATPFLTLPSGVVLNIGVAPGSSTSAADTIKNFAVTLTAGQRYVAVANGVLNPSNFAVNPDGTSTAFTLFIKDNIRSTATNSTDVEFIVVHGASDAPTVDVIARGVATLVNDAAYSNITPYITVPAARYVLDVTAAAGTPTVASYIADLSGLGGGTAVILASGFLTPSTNKDGADFGLLAVLADGTSVLLSKPSLSIVEKNMNTNFVMYPNPTNGVVNISLLNYNNISTIEITNALGQVVKTETTNNSNVLISTNELTKGIYFVKVLNEIGQAVSKLIVE